MTEAKSTEKVPETALMAFNLTNNVFVHDPLNLGTPTPLIDEIVKMSADQPDAELYRIWGENLKTFVVTGSPSALMTAGSYLKSLNGMEKLMSQVAQGCEAAP